MFYMHVSNIYAVLQNMHEILIITFVAKNGAIFILWFNPSLSFTPFLAAIGEMFNIFMRMRMTETTLGDTVLSSMVRRKMF